MPIVYPSLPSPSQFKKDSSVLLADRTKDKVLIALDTLLVEYFAIRGKSVTEIRIKQQKHLAKLWFTCDYWLKIVDGGKRYLEASNMNASRRPVIYELFKCITETLVARTGVPVNKLPDWLMITFGRGMDQHGVELDALSEKAKYLTSEELSKYRLHFNAGHAFQEKWWDNSKDLVRADSLNSRIHDKADQAAHDEGLSGYAVSLGRDFYLAHHFVQTSGKNFYHSSYLGGQSVLCAGTMKIVNGEVLLITDSSGHYRPSEGHLAMAVEALGIVGVSLEKLKVRVFPNKVYTGNEFLTKVDFNVTEHQAKELKRELHRLLIYNDKGNSSRAANAETNRVVRGMVTHMRTEHGGRKGPKCPTCKTWDGQSVFDVALWVMKNIAA